MKLIEIVIILGIAEYLGCLLQVSESLRELVEGFY